MVDIAADWCVIGDPVADAATQTLALPTPQADPLPAAVAAEDVAPMLAGIFADYGVTLAVSALTGTIGFGLGIMMHQRWTRLASKREADMAAVPAVPLAPEAVDKASSSTSVPLAKAVAVAVEMPAVLEGRDHTEAVPMVDINDKIATNAKAVWQPAENAVPSPEATDIASWLSVAQSTVQSSALAQHVCVPATLTMNLPPVSQGCQEGLKAPSSQALPIAESSRQKSEKMAHADMESRYRQTWQGYIVLGLGTTLIVSSICLARYGMMRAALQAASSAQLKEVVTPALPACTKSTAPLLGGPAIAPAVVKVDAQGLIEASPAEKMSSLMPMPSPSNSLAIIPQAPAHVGYGMDGNTGVLRDATPAAVVSKLLNSEVVRSGVPLLPPPPGGRFQNRSYPLEDSTNNTMATVEMQDDSLTIDMPMKILCASSSSRRTVHRAQEVWIFGGKVRPPLPTNSPIFRLLPKQ